MTAVHARHSPALGRKVAVAHGACVTGRGSRSGFRIGRTTKRVQVRGTITYVNARRGTFVVSVRGVSHCSYIGVEPKRHGARAASASSPSVGAPRHGHWDAPRTGPQPHGRCDRGCTMTVRTSAESTLRGVVQAIDTTTSTLAVSADTTARTVRRGIDGPGTSTSFDLTLFHQGSICRLIVRRTPTGPTRWSNPRMTAVARVYRQSWRAAGRRPRRPQASAGRHVQRGV